jgi:ABC-type arginine/histidine transport system permease subunit
MALAALLVGRPAAGEVPAPAGGDVELFRGTPVLLQHYVLYFGLAP